MRGGARIQVNVPDPRHDDLLGDPTHVRPVTLDTLGPVGQRFNRRSACSQQAEHAARADHQHKFRRE